MYKLIIFNLSLFLKSKADLVATAAHALTVSGNVGKAEYPQTSRPFGDFHLIYRYCSHIWYSVYAYI